MSEEKDYRQGQRVIACITIEDHGQDFTELDVLENGVLLGNSVMFSHGRLSLLGIGSNDGMDYYPFSEFTTTDRKAFKGLTIYMYDTGTKEPLPWKAPTLRYPVVKVGLAEKPDRFLK